MPIALGLLSAFLLGGVPFALVVVRVCKGVDIRTIGSGNVGATNASRAFEGRRSRVLAFCSIYLLDAAKGFVPAFWGAGWLAPWSADASPIALATALGAAAIIGHVFTPFLRFKGGKGVATATGVLFALDWPVAAIAIGVFFVVRLLTGQVFWGSLGLGIGLSAAAILLHLANGAAFAERLPVTLLCSLLAAFLFWTHRSNLQRFFRAAGEEA